MLYKVESFYHDTSRAAPYNEKVSAICARIHIRAVGRCYRDGLGAELDFKKVFDVSNDGLKASNTSISSVFRTLC